MGNNALEQIAAGNAAKRYAEAITAAAGAEEKIAALTEAVRDAEYYRLLAESQLNTATWPEGIGDVLHVGTEPPSDEVYGLIDLYSGEAYTRYRVNGQVVPNEWVHADKGGSTITYSWPIGSDAGPFIKLKDDWSLVSLVRDLRQRNEQADRIRRVLYHKDGFRDADAGAWTAVDVADGTLRVVAALEHKHAELMDENRKLERKLHAAEAEIRRYLEADEKQGAEA